MRDYTYSVARIRAKETELLTRQEIEQLLNAEDYSAALRIIQDKGYENDGSVTDAAERSLWEFIGEIDRESVLKVLRIPIDYHNIKVAVKSLEKDGYELLLDFGTVDKSVIYNSIRNNNELPDGLSDVAERAMSKLLRTQDSQLCDIEIDKAELAAMYSAAKSSGDEFIKRYAEHKIHFTNLKTALRCAMMDKSQSFIENALFSEPGQNINLLAKAAEGGKASLIEYLEKNGGSEAAEYMKKSAVAFEKWCDDKIMSIVNEARYDSFSVAPIIAYAYAKMTEINTVRLILSAKRNKLDMETVRERVRELYV